MVARGLEIAYFGLHIFSIASLTVLTTTLVFVKSPGSQRPNPLLAANTSSYVAFGIVACLLLFTNHVHGPEPSAPLCQAQSALMLAFPPALGGLALSLVLTVWRLAWHVHSERTPWFSQGQFNTLLIAFPYVTFILFTVSGAIVGTRSKVSRQDYYCMTDNNSMTTASAAVTVILLFGTCVFQAWTVLIVLRRYRESRKFGREEIGTDVPLFLRVLAFGLFVFIALALSIVAVIDYTLPIPDIMVACLGPMIFLVFGSQDEVLRAWRLKQPLPRTQDRSDSIATLNSARPPRNSNTFSVSTPPAIAEVHAITDLHSYRFPPPSPSSS